MEQSIIAKINKVPIVIFDREKLVPIKPICEALGVNFPSQYSKIKEDDILNPTVVLSTTVGGDKKDREMVCLPLKFVFGWLFSINHKNVKPEAQEAVRKYKLECYHALYKHFTEHTDFIEERQRIIEEKLTVIETTRKNFKNAQADLQKANEELNEVRKMNFNDWKAQKMQQQVIDFKE